MLPRAGRRQAAVLMLRNHNTMMLHILMHPLRMTLLALLRVVALAVPRKLRCSDEPPVPVPVARSRLWLRPAGRRSDWCLRAPDA
eukprot:8882712-Alexandrium_andersonii.AAC.1